MARGRINWQLIIVILIAMVLLAATAVGLRSWFRSKTVKGGYTQGQEAFKNQQWHLAAQKLGEYLALRSDDIDMLILYGDAQLNRRPKTLGNYQEATNAYRRALRLDENNVDAMEKISDLYIEIGGYHELEVKASEFLVNNDNVKVHHNLIKALVNQRKFKEAALQALNIIEKHPDYIYAYDILGVLAQQRPDISDHSANYWFDLAIKNNPQSMHAYTIRGVWQLGLGNKKLAISEFKKAMSLDNGDVMQKLILAKCLIDAQEFALAEEICQAVELTEPRNLQLWQIRAISANISGDKKQMLFVANTASEKLGEKYWDFLPFAIEMYILSESYENAEKNIEKLKELENSRQQVLFYKGFLSYKQGNVLESIPNLKEAVELGYKTARARILLASAYSETSNTTAGIQQLRALISERPENFNARLNLAKLSFQIDDAIGAAEQAQMALQVRSYDLDAQRIYLRASIRSLEKAGVEPNSQEWIELNEKIEKFQAIEDDSLPFIYGQFKLAISQKDIDRAKEILGKIQTVAPDSLESEIAKIDIAQKTGQNVDIEPKLIELVNKFPTNLEPVEYLARHYVTLDQTDKCMSVLETAIKNTTRLKSKIQIGLILANMSLGTKNEDRACQILQDIASQSPDSLVLKRKLLSFKQIYSSEELSQDIIAQIRKIEGDKGWQWKYEQAKLWSRLGQFDQKREAIEALLKEALIDDPANNTLRIFLANVYSQNQDWPNATAAYREIVNRDPDNADAIASLVAILYKTNEFTQAQYLLKEAATRKLSSPTLDRLRMQDYLRSVDDKTVSQTLLEVVNKNPQDTNARLSLALVYIRLEDYDSAKMHLDILSQSEPDSIAVYMARMELYASQKLIDQVITIGNDLVEKFDNNSAYIARGRAFVMLGEDAKAEADFLTAIQKDSSNEQSHVVLSSFYNSSGQGNKAIAVIEKALEIKPDSVVLLKHAIVTLGMSDLQANKEKAGLLIEKALGIYPQDTEFRILKAKYMLAKGTFKSYDVAADILEKILKDYPGNAEAWQMLATISLDTGKPNAAIEHATKGLVYSPQNKDLLLIRARALAVNSPLQADKMLQELNLAYPRDGKLLMIYCDVLVKVGDVDKAVKLLREEIELSAESDQKRSLNMMLALALSKAGDSEKSQALFDELEKQSPGDLRLFNTRIRMMVEEKKWLEVVDFSQNWLKENPGQLKSVLQVPNMLLPIKDVNAKSTALQILEKISKMYPDNLQVQGSLGITYYMNGQSGKAVAVYKRILSTQPENIVAINDLAWIICEEDGDYDAALTLANQGVGIAPHYEDLRDTRGVIYYRIGEYEKAIEDFKIALDLIPAGNQLAAGAYFHLGRTYCETGDKIRASDALEKALFLDPKARVLTADDIATIRKLLYKLGKI